MRVKFPKFPDAIHEHIQCAVFLYVIVYEVSISVTCLAVSLERE